MGLKFEKDIAQIKLERRKAKEENERRKKLIAVEVEGAEEGDDGNDEDSDTEYADETAMTSRSIRSRLGEERRFQRPNFNRKTLARHIQERKRQILDEESEPIFSAISLPRPIASIGTSERNRGVRVAAGYYHSLVTNPQGQVLSFGDGRHGQLGLGKSVAPISVEIPQLVVFPGLYSFSSPKSCITMFANLKYTLILINISLACRCYCFRGFS